LVGRNTEEKKMKVGATGLMTLAVAFMFATFVPSMAFAGPIDSDFDGVVDDNDNCPNDYNPLQENDDNDNWGDACDNCLGVDNTLGGVPVDQCDTDQDGYGNLCDGDFNEDNVVGIPDFGVFSDCFVNAGTPEEQAACDCNCDGVVGIPDFGCFSAQFTQTVPGASGRTCAGSQVGNTGYCPPANQ
jgi:hypothetical protein